MALGQPATVTVTGVTGPNSAVTALTLTNVTGWSVNCLTNVLEVVANGKTKHFDISPETTLTWTVSSNVYTLTIAA